MNSIKLLLAATLLTAGALAGCDSCKGGNKGGSDAATSAKPQTPKMIDCMKASAVASPHATALAAYPAWNNEADAKKGAELAKKAAEASAAYKGTDESVNKAFAAWADSVKALGPALDEMATAMGNAEKITAEIREKKQAGNLKKDEEQAMVSKMIDANAAAQTKVNPVSAQQKKAYGDLVDLCKGE